MLANRATVPLHTKASDQITNNETSVVGNNSTQLQQTESENHSGFASPTLR